MKHSHLSKQVVLLQNATLKFPILPRANRKCFLLVHCKTRGTQSCFAVPRLAFLIGFPITSSKPLVLNWISFEETINKPCILHLSLKPDEMSRKCRKESGTEPSRRKYDGFYYCEEYLTSISNKIFSLSLNLQIDEN